MLRSELDRLKVKKNSAFKLDPSIKYSLRDSHKLFSILKQTCVEGKSDPAQVVDYSHHLIQSSDIIDKLVKVL